MSTSLIIGNSPYTNSNLTLSTLSISLAGISSHVASTFWAYEPQTINRIYFSTGPITNRANFNLIVGIGTVDRNLGLPSAIGNTLNFLSSVKVLGTGLTTNAQYIVSIPDVTTTRLEKYYVGFAITDFVTNGSFSIVHKGIAPVEQTMNTSPTIVNFGYRDVLGQNRFVNYNWGYDSGNAVTSWYNVFPGFGLTAPLVGIALNNLAGFTFTYDADVDQIYVESVRIYFRNPGSTFPTGFGTTFYSVLYDSDGTTALIATTFNCYTTNSTQIGGFIAPINSWINSGKLYHFAFAADSNVVSTSNQLYNNFMPYSFQSNGCMGFTSVFFTKASGSSAPVYTNDRVIPFQMYISNMRGTVQNSEGAIIVF